MAYSFVKTGGSGEAYDILAEEIQGTVFFAGEVGFITPTPITFIWITLLLVEVVCVQSLKATSNTVKSLMATNGRYPDNILLKFPEQPFLTLFAVFFWSLLHTLRFLLCCLWI